MRLLEQCSDLIGWAFGSKRRSNLAVSDLMSCVHVCVCVCECVLEWPVTGSLCYVDCIRMNTDPNLTDKHTCSPTKRLKTFSSYIIYCLPRTKLFFRSFCWAQWSFPRRFSPELLATAANSLSEASFPSALCFSYSSIRDSRETALGSADWNVKCYSLKIFVLKAWLSSGYEHFKCAHWGLDSLVLWDMMGEVQLNQGLLCWFNSWMIIFENMLQKPETCSWIFNAFFETELFFRPLFRNFNILENREIDYDFPNIVSHCLELFFIINIMSNDNHHNDEIPYYDLKVLMIIKK